MVIERIVTDFLYSIMNSRKKTNDSITVSPTTTPFILLQIMFLLKTRTCGLFIFYSVLVEKNSLNFWDIGLSLSWMNNPWTRTWKQDLKHHFLEKTAELSNWSKIKNGWSLENTRCPKPAYAASVMIMAWNCLSESRVPNLFGLVVFRNSYLGKVRILLFPHLSVN